MRGLLAAALVLTGSVAGVLASAPEASLRPVGRAGTDARNPVSVAQSVAAADAVQAVVGSTASSQGVVILSSAEAPGLGQSLRPEVRSQGIVQKAMAKRKQRRKGAVCGDLDIQGEDVGRVPGKLNGCGVSNAVRVRSVAGVSLSQGSVMDCGTAKALKSWIVNGARPAIGSKGGGLARLKVAAHYACRTRNNKTGAKISEHGKGRAIDISGFTLNDGSTITVLKGWRTRGQSKALRQMHRAACGPFGTVLGPEADRYHQDHFHFDTARYRSGPYCR